jgi:LuxR family maltose regulon positive regulatory protein
VAAHHAAQLSRNYHADLIAAGFLGLLHAARGKLHQAAIFLRQRLQGREELPASALAHRMLSALLYEWNELEACAEHLDQATVLAQRAGNAEILYGVYHQLAKLRQTQGDSAGALAALELADKVIRERHLPAIVQARNAAAHVELAVAQGDLATARYWAEQRSQPVDASPLYPLLDLTPARLLLAQGEQAASAHHLAAQHARAQKASWHYGELEVRTLQALAALTQASALDFLSAAVTLAEPEGFVRTFLDKGPAMAELLRQGTAAGLVSPYASTLLATGSDTAIRTPQVPPAEAGVLPLVEPLSERELEILRLLSEHRTNAEIALALTVSLNTIKTHLQHIYGKLGVHDRREAVRQASQWHLLQ